MRLRCIGVICILGMALMAPLLPAQAHRVDAVNPSPEGEFPGGRGRNQMVIYTPEFHRPNTGTNVLGSEALVVDGVVTRLGANNSEIPEDGYVISGNGESQSWMIRNLSPGTPVVLDDTAVRVNDNFEGRQAALTAQVEETQQRLREFPGTEEQIEQAQELLEQIHELKDPFPALAQRAASLEAEAFARELAAMPSPDGEVRAVWNWLPSASPEEIIADVQALADAHVNAIFPEVNYGSCGVYPDPTGLFPEMDEFKGTDMLPLLIEECHARGIEVHAWVHDFYLGPPSRAKYVEQFVAAHPEWVSVNRRGEDNLVPYGYRYPNPANLEFQRALIASHVAMIAKYDFDGYHYDHIRYCMSFSWQSGWDYSDYTRARVREELGFDPLDITPDANPREWARWIDWRQQQVTNYVRDNSAAIRAVRPGILITAAIFPDLGEAIENKGQNWGAWVDQGFIDAAIPMSYTPDTGEMMAATTELADLSRDNGNVVIGLGPYLGFSTRLLVHQIVASRQAGATGQCLFAWARLSDAERRALAEGPWRSTSRAHWVRPSD